MSKKIRRIAISTGGGDAPGLNAVIRSVVISAIYRGWECYGIRDGFNGILGSHRYPEGIIPLTRDRVRGIAHLGGTILGTTNKGNPLKYPTRLADGTIAETDRSDEIVAYFQRHRLDALVSVGGRREVLAPAGVGQVERLGGIGEQVARALQERTGKDARVVVLGHLLRGGSPTSFDRLAALRFGAAAVRALESETFGVMVALAHPNVEYVALEEVAGRMKGVPLDSDILQTGRDIGIAFGD